MTIGYYIHKIRPHKKKSGSATGLANAFPRESVDMFNCGVNGETEKAFELYRWFLPLLRMNAVPNFVQLIKLVQAEVGIGNPGVRPPHLELADSELEETRNIIRDALYSRSQSANASRVAPPQIDPGVITGEGRNAL